VALNYALGSDYTFAAGAPLGRGGDGYVKVTQYFRYEDPPTFGTRRIWNGATDSKEACGTSVDADHFFLIIGCPGYGPNNNGRVRVIWQGQQDGSFDEELGSIVGQDGDRLGEKGTIAITQTSNSFPPPDADDYAFDAVSVTVATASGEVQTWYYLQGEWTKQGNPTTNNGPVRIAGRPHLRPRSYVAIGASNFEGSSSIFLQEFASAPSTTVPTGAPTEDPTPPTTSSQPTTFAPTPAPNVSNSAGSTLMKSIAMFVVVTTTISGWLLVAI